MEKFNELVDNIWGEIVFIGASGIKRSDVERWVKLVLESK